MSKYRNNLPMSGEKFFVTDAGLETILVFKENMDLPGMAAFPLATTPEGMERLKAYYKEFIGLARDNGIGCVLETATWRAHPDWAEPTGNTMESLAAANRNATTLLNQVRDEEETPETPIVISGCLGPRGDGYVPSKIMTAEEAEKYHGWQINILRDAGADLITAMTINYVDEAIGVIRASKAAGMPVVISFTVETDGKLPTGQSLKEAITAVDEATESYPAYYMVNCAHPTHYAQAFTDGEDWVNRIGGLRPNSSSKSHEELDDSETLDEGNPEELGQQHISLAGRLPNLKVVGGCCGTDIRHVREICNALSDFF